MKRKNLIILGIIFGFYSCKNEPESDSNNTLIKSLISPKIKKEKPCKCNFETYLEYLNSVPIYEKADTPIVSNFKFEDDPEYDFGGGFLFKNSKDGFLQIGKDPFYPAMENLWVHHTNIKIGTTNYDGSKIPIYQDPKVESIIVEYIVGENYFDAWACNGQWALVEYNGILGWLSPEYQCNNPVTNCN